MVTKSERTAEFVYAAETNIINQIERELDVIKVGVSANIPARMVNTHRNLLFSMPDSITWSKRSGRIYGVGELEQRIISFCDTIGILYQGDHGKWSGSTELIRFSEEAQQVLIERIGESDVQIREFFEGVFEARGLSLTELEESLLAEDCAAPKSDY